MEVRKSEAQEWARGRDLGHCGGWLVTSPLVFRDYQGSDALSSVASRAGRRRNPRMEGAGSLLWLGDVHKMSLILASGSGSGQWFPSWP